ARQSRFVGLQARQSLFLLGNVIVHNSQPADQRLKSESLKDERSEDDAKREEEDKVAAGKRCAISQDKRNSERAGQRIGAAHSGPGDQGCLLPGRRISPAKCRAEETRQVGCNEEPEKTNKDDR